MEILANSVVSDQAKIGKFFSTFNMKSMYLSNKNTNFLCMGSSLILRNHCLDMKLDTCNGKHIT